MNHYILYQAYGNEQIICECKYALLRLFDVYNIASSKAPKVVIYTDQPNEFSLFRDNLSIIIEPIDEGIVSAWKGANNFVHRVKIAVMQHCLTKYGGKLIYMDTDTYCLQTLGDIFTNIDPTNVFFHLKEGKISTSSQFKKWRFFLLSAQNPMPQRAMSMEIDMWNAGVIGLHQAHLPLLQKVLDTTDIIYPLFPRHTVEQFAFCKIFQQENITFSPSDSFILHYWRLKEFRDFIQLFFKCNQHKKLLELAKESKLILPEIFMQDKINYEEINSLKKLWLKLNGKSWSMPKYQIKAAN